tara:strand:- start:114 stop:1592 length:1479 start_codon:yes stop_codon:yes gene_type:complete
MASIDNDQVPMDQDPQQQAPPQDPHQEDPQQDPQPQGMRIYEDDEEPPAQDEGRSAESKNGKSKASEEKPAAAAAAKPVTTLTKVDYESELVTNMQEYNNLQVCDVTGRRFPKGGKIIQSCMAPIQEAQYDKGGNMFMPEIRPHFVSEECHQAGDYIADKGDCLACLKAALKFPGHKVCKAITHVVMLNYSCMRMNDLAYEHQDKYDENKKKEQANAIAAEKARGGALRKEEVDKKRERKRHRLTKQVADQQAKVEEAESALESAQGRAEPQPERIAHNGEEGEGDVEMEDRPGHDDVVEQAEQAKADEAKRLNDLRLELSEFEDNKDDEGDDTDGEEQPGSSTDPPPAKKSKKRERTPEEKADTQAKRAASLAAKKREKEEAAKETAAKVQNHDKMVEENKDLRDEYTSLHQKLLKTVEIANEQTKDAQKLEDDMTTTINLQKYWVREFIDPEKIREMDKWIFKTQTKKKELVKKINDEAAVQREAQANEA